MALFTNVSNDTLSVNAPENRPDAHLVEPGEVLRVPGDAVDQGDAYVVGEGDKARAYPKALWDCEDAVLPELETEPGGQLPELPASAYAADATPLDPDYEEPADHSQVDELGPEQQ